MSILAIASRIAAKVPVPYTGRRGSVLSLARQDQPGDTLRQLEALAHNGTLYAIIDALSTAVSSVDWTLYRVPTSGRKLDDEEREPVLGHAALDLWKVPNSFMTGEFLRELSQMYLDLTGKSHQVVVKVGGLPIEIWPVRPDRMTPVPHVTKFLAGWIYTSPDGEQIPLKVDEVLFTRKPDPLDIYGGLAATDSVSVDVEAADYAARWNRNFFINSAEPGGVIEVERRLDDDEFDEMATRWNEQHRGVNRAHRVAIIEQGKWVSNAVSQRDMQFAELRHVSRDVIMEAFRVSKTALGITDDVNRAAALAAEYQFSRHLTVPRLNRWRGTLNFQFLPMFGSTSKGVEFDYDSPVDEDTEVANAERVSKATAAKTLIDAHLDPVAVLEWAGLPPMEHTEPAVPGIDPETGLPLPPAPPADPNAPGSSPAVPPGKTPVKPPAKPVPSKPPSPSKALRSATEMDLSQVAAAWQAALDDLLSAWPAATLPQRVALVSAITAALEAQDVATLGTLSVDTGETLALLGPALDALGEVAASAVVVEGAAAGVELSVVVPATAATAGAVAALAGGALALAAGREAFRLLGSDTAGEIGRQVATYLAALPPPHAELAGALTGAQNAARIATFGTGPIGSLYASEQLDSRTCGPCAAHDGRFLCNTDDLGPVEKLYSPLGGYVDCLGGVRCRGTVVGVWRSDTGGNHDQH